MNLMQLPMALAWPGVLRRPAAPSLFVFRLGADLLLPTLALGVVGLTSHYCLTQAFRSGDATVVVPLDFLRIPLIALVGWMFYGEAIDVFVFAGAGLIICGVLWNLLAESRRPGCRWRPALRRPNPPKPDKMCDRSSKLWTPLRASSRLRASACSGCVSAHRGMAIDDELDLVPRADCRCRRLLGADAARPAQQHNRRSLPARRRSSPAESLLLAARSQLQAFDRGGGDAGRADQVRKFEEAARPPAGRTRSPGGARRGAPAAKATASSFCSAASRRSAALSTTRSSRCAAISTASSRTCERLRGGDPGQAREVSAAP